MEESKAVRRKIGTLQGVIVALVAYIVVFTCLAGYCGYFLLQKYEGLQGDVLILRQQIREINEIAKQEDSVPNIAQKKERREVLSSTAEIPHWIKGLAGPAGPAGPPGSDGMHGKDGKDGRDGRDAFSIPAVEQLINKTITEKMNHEHSRLAASLPVYGGSVYTRWGKTSCSKDAKLIYKGQMAGPDLYSVGGGSNFQCLPMDPDLAQAEASKGKIYNQLRPTFITALEQAGPLPHSQHLPCAVCEAIQRVSQVTMPGKSRCPDEWSLEYSGYLMSPATTWSNDHKMEYVCIDSAPEAISTRKVSRGAILYFATAQCSGDARLDICPPYKDNHPLQCVICTK